jgi:FAD synthase
VRHLFFERLWDEMRFADLAALKAQIAADAARAGEILWAAVEGYW